MLENFFLTYANHSLRDSPENLHKIFKEIFSYINPEEFYSRAKAEKIIEAIISFAKTNDPKIEDKCRKIEKKADPIHSQAYDVAFEAGYLYRDGFCEHNCIKEHGIDLTELLRRSGFENMERLRCYECRQLHFINFLSEIASGKKYREIKNFVTVNKLDHEMFSKKLNRPVIKIGDKVLAPTSHGLSFENYLSRAYDCVSMKVSIIDNERLEEKDFVELRNLCDGDSSCYSLGTRFNDYLTSLVIFSLTQFLLHNDRRKIHKCPICGKFVTGRISRIYCSKKCNNKANRLTKEEMRIYQKEYRKNGTGEIDRETEIELNEEEIKRFMKRLEMSREDVIEMIKEEKNM